MSIMWHINKIIKNKKWKKRNKHNFTSISNIFNFDQVHVGNATYGPLYVMTDGVDAKLSIGHFCSIAPDVKFVLQSDHPTDCLSTFPFKVIGGLEDKEAVTKGDIVIEDDVWIGYGAIILSGVRICRGAVVGAGTVVTKDVSPYTIVAGNPGRVIKKRFSDEIQSVLNQIDYSKIQLRNVKELLDELYTPINSVEDAINLVNKLNDIKL